MMAMTSFMAVTPLDRAPARAGDMIDNETGPRWVCLKLPRGAGVRTISATS
jgi:hypothetical protein